MNPAKHFHVLIGAPTLADHLPHGPALVVDADQTQLDRLASDLKENAAVFSFPCVLLCAVVSAEPGQLLPWFSFSDGRFDGVLAPEHWTSGAGNLRCLHQQTRTGQTLAALLDEAALPLEEHQTGCLLMRQGDPLAAIAGCGDWAALFQTVQVLSPQAEKHWAGVLAGQLEPLGFRRQDDGLLFQRSGLQMLRSLVERLQDQRAALVQERDEQLSERRQLAQTLEDAQQTHAKELARVQDFADQRLDETRRELNGSCSVLIEERDQLKQHLDALELSHAQSFRDATEQHRREIEQLEQEIRFKTLQQEALARASSASVHLITDLMLDRRSDSPFQ
ncbi:hypothetical protein [Synechococcus sp. MIT S1220]|uniref:hypothetical protein n=1 Tax=Synechococcus sp. MIT S1220 TaxID=3082549 RepID=UPI0039B05E79